MSERASCLEPRKPDENEPDGRVVTLSQLADAAEQAARRERELREHL